VILTDGSPREIGYNMARGKPNTARFEAPEMQEMATPVARFRWVSVERPGGGVDKVLQCELFDADNSRVGAEIFQKLKDGIASPPVTNLAFLGREETVLSKSDQDHSQWYRLDSI
jgi:hypothetical protein